MGTGGKVGRSVQPTTQLSFTVRRCELDLCGLGSCSVAGFGISTEHSGSKTTGNAYKIMVRIPEGKRPLARPRRRCDDNISMDLTEIG
jgi:hypothetical protein